MNKPMDEENDKQAGLVRMAKKEAAGEKLTLATSIYNSLRADILGAQLRPGERLRIDALAERFDVSGSAVREALSRLSTERLVDRYEQRGFRVPAVALEEWRALVRTRCWVETRALEESMKRRSDAWEDSLVLAFHRLSRLAWSAEPEAHAQWQRAHRVFHQTLIGNCDSPWLVEFCDTLADHAQRYISVSNAVRREPRDGEAEHERLMKTALSGDIEAASAALTAHYTTTLKAIENALEASDGVPDTLTIGQDENAA